MDESLYISQQHNRQASNEPALTYSVMNRILRYHQPILAAAAASTSPSIIYNTYGQVANDDELISDGQASVHLGGSSVHDFRNVDAIIAGDVLVSGAASNAEAQPLVSFGQFDFNDARRTCHDATSSYTLKKISICW